ncbi:hypothetical protein GOBAR_AA08784 [Gossypium barbadense]|uniref:Uncharacterized protein n=1 Tax=Gossypium barbadense TaxID=3634 RepID=A0A2P5Y8K7_GOSBA|nr:hypothetical protein GOBAR_AA08784 [Gossypium barbadense]
MKPRVASFQGKEEGGGNDGKDKEDNEDNRIEDDDPEPYADAMEAMFAPECPSTKAVVLCSHEEDESHSQPPYLFYK